MSAPPGAPPHRSGTPAGRRGDPERTVPVADRDHCLGPVDARYTLVEYADYQCPDCAEAETAVKEVVRELDEELCFAFRNFPNATAHPNAVGAAEAAEAADQQGKFWLMHDRLFQHQAELSEGEIRRLARELPIDLHDFDRDLASGAPARRVAEDLESGRNAGVSGTPTFFVNGRRHDGSNEFLPLLRALQGST